MSKLIAIVAIAAQSAGERITFEPGAEVKGLSAIDIADLKRSGALYDEDDLAADEKTAAGAEKKAAQEFAKARKAVQAADATARA